MRTVAAGLALVLFVLGIANFIWLFAESSALSGDGLNGYEKDGHYYVMSHGTATEVSREDWQHSRLHVLSLCITHPLAMAAAAYLLFQIVFPLVLYRASRETLAQTAQLVRQSGPPLATAWSSARIGSLNFRGPLLQIAVYPGGFWLQPLLMAACAIPTAEIRAVTRRGGLLGGLEISHTSRQIAGPIIVYCDAQSALGQALRTLVGQAPTPSERPTQRLPPQ